MDFLNHREGGMVFYQDFLLTPLQCTVTELETVRGCVSLKKYKSQDKAVEVTVNSKEETLFVWISYKNSTSGCVVNTVPEFIDPRVRENKPKTLVFSH